MADSLVMVWLHRFAPSYARICAGLQKAGADVKSHSAELVEAKQKLREAQEAELELQRQLEQARTATVAQVRGAQGSPLES